ncbi:TylF/MycF/NovP-related O-methyltransferase [Kibdelosporangium persicum]|uniref:Demethyldecarbamoylnovobiocin O-methyltransferase n=1 Tax=Kibdelosporangium persicum TaxID=2698649 RepID=A0ABX2FIR3_9PSEU|nr:TylF/MycF/NovP-related O-methyltransferase [Kibdelosporangium persicum]NRN70651.1 Demethyldecarbamoylnovobiocin O-methyltransferase [Kibdelosporangium persicum]
MEPKVLLRLAEENRKMSSLDRLIHIHWVVRHLLTCGIPGHLVEVGCHAGGTSVYLKMLIDEFDPTRELHLYDSFQGMPTPSGMDSRLSEGDYRSSVDDVRAVFARWEVELPSVHAGWFEDTLPRELPDKIAFAYLDSDFYDSIGVSLAEVWPRVVAGGMVLVDDYGDRSRNPHSWEGLPGVRKAVDEFFADRVEKPFMLAGTSALSMVCVEKKAVAM